MKHTRLGNFSLGLALAALGLSGALVVGAQAPGDGPGLGMGPHRPPMERAMGPHGDHGRWWNDAHAIEKFKLTDTQRKAMDEIYQQHRLTLVDLHATLEKAELAMEPMMGEDQPDEGKILSQIDRVAAARAELEKANARMLFELRRQLTPEQWKLIQADRTAHRENHGPDGAGAHWHGQGRGQSGQPGPGAQGGPGGGAAPPPPGEQE
jgi:Spy/CpxP family protein refolding chaperone